MAVAFGAAGTIATASVTTPGAVAVATPAGVVSGNLLLAFLVYDCNTNPTAPAGWTLVQRVRSATAGGSYQPPTAEVWRRVSNGTEGASQTWTFSTSSWPAGRPDVIGRMLSYTGTDPATPVEVSASASDSGSTLNSIMSHPQLTTAVPNGWLLSFRGSSGTTSTYSVSPSDTNRSGSSYRSLNMFVWDNAAALPSGLQTQRTSTANTFGSWDGDTAVSLAIKILPSASAGVAQAQTANGTGTAFGVTSASVNGPWDNCGPGGLPEYTWAVDWPQTGLAAAGKILSSNPYVRQDLAGWSSSGATISRSTDLLAGRSVPMTLVVPDGVSASGGVTALPHSAVGAVVPGQQYIADCWVYAPVAWADVRTAVDWWTSADVFVSTGLGVASSVPAGVWTHLTQTLTAPATASRHSVRFRFGSTPPSADVFYVFGLMLLDPLQAEQQITPAARPGRTGETKCDRSAPPRWGPPGSLSTTCAGSTARTSPRPRCPGPWTRRAP